jgi:short-subunit dehydrogenase
MKALKNIVITGASSGLGAALAARYAAPGRTLGLLGRDEARLKVVAAACEAKGATTTLATLHVTDRNSMRDWLLRFDDAHPVSLVIANAGISAGTGGTVEEDAQVQQIFDVNVDGVLNTVQPLIARMVERKSGQIALMSSLAGLRGLPSTPAYSGSKAAVRLYGEGLRGALGKYGVQVSVICPGYIKTPMTDVNDFPMPFLMSAENAANRIAHGLQKNLSRIAFPRRLYWPLWWLTCLSPTLTDWFFAALPAKPAK